MLDYTPNQPPKFKTKNWVKINDKSGGSYNEDNQIRFKTSMLRSSSFNYSYAYILVKGTITVTNTAAQGAANNAANKKVIFKNLAPFTNCIDSINNTQIDDGHDIDVVIPMYNLIVYSDIQKHLEFHGSIVEINGLQLVILILLILMQITLLLA